MEVENALYPVRGQIEVLRNDSSPQPIVMLNLLKFRAKAQYSDGRETDLTGEQAFDIYIETMRKSSSAVAANFSLTAPSSTLRLAKSRDSGTERRSFNILRRRNS